MLISDPVLEKWFRLGRRTMLAGLLALNALDSVIDHIYSTVEVSLQRPIKGYLQIDMIILWVAGGVVIVARLADRSIGLFVGGLGAYQR